MPVSGFLRAGPPVGERAAQPSSLPVPPAPPVLAGQGAHGDGAQRNNTLSVIAGIGVLLLAMGVGVLIGRSSSSPPAARPEVVTVASAPTTGAGSGSGEATFVGDWPAGKSAYTVQLRKLPEAGTSVGQVEQAKTGASSNGAGSVGALKSEEFSSLTAGSYIVYSGQYRKRAEAQKALSGLAKKFPGAKVIHVSNGAGSSSRSPAGGKAAGHGSGSDINHPAPPSVLEGVSNSKGKSYEEKSKNLPDVVETG